MTKDNCSRDFERSDTVCERDWCKSPNRVTVTVILRSLDVIGRLVGVCSTVYVQQFTEVQTRRDHVRSTIRWEEIVLL